jgi:hypothetical protein
MEGTMKTSTVIGKILMPFLLLGFLATACSMSAEKIISGTVNQDDSGKIIIAADNGESYLIKGMDLSTMIGKTVKVTGTLAEEGDHKSITVMKMEEIENLEDDEDLEDVDK